METFEAYQARSAMHSLPGYYRPGNDVNIVKFYAGRSMALYRSFAKRMANYEQNGDARQKHIAKLFTDANK